MNQDQIKAKIVASMTADEKHQCRMLNVSPEDWAEQRMHELATGNTNGVDMGTVPPRRTR